MKAIVIIIALLTYMSIPMLSQWSAVPSGTNDELYDIHFANDSTGWACGTYGKLLKTTNMGASWVNQFTGTSNHLFGMHFFDANLGCTVGVSGTLRRTSNGGATWTGHNSATNIQLRSVFFADVNNAWAVGGSGTITHSTNSGQNWSLQNSGFSGWLNDVFFINSSMGWAVGDNGTILFTNNGGASWSLQTSNTQESFYKVHFINSNYGWIVGTNGAVFKTTNSGATWTSQISGSSAELRSVYFININVGWAVGNNGTILRTINGGTSWTSQGSAAYGMLFNVFFNNANSGWAVGTNGAILRSTPPLVATMVPANNATNIPLTTNLSWTSDYSSVYPFYRLQLSKSPNFDTMIVNQVVSTDYYQLSNLLEATDYYWRVKFDASSAQYSPVHKFTTTNLGYTLSGNLKYANSIQTPMSNCQIIIKDSNNAIIARDTTDIAGNFSIASIPNGSYAIEIITSKTSGGINLLDLLFIRQRMAGLISFDALQEKAGDINVSGNINLLDVLALRQKMANIPTNYWLVPDFVFYPQAFTISDANVNLNVQAKCGGDVNGSFVPFD